MDDTPDIAPIARLMGDRARATMLMGLMTGRALTATELARAAGVTKQTASAHLAKLARVRLVAVERAGRHRYYRLANRDVAATIERLMGLAGRVGAVRVNSGPSDPALRKARVCYDHLAGDLGVLVFDSFKARGFIRSRGRALALTGEGERFCAEMGIDVAALKRARRPLCLPCLDWSVRRHHLAGALGAAILRRCFALGWARAHPTTRVVSFSAVGERTLRATLTAGR
ncbi:MAG: ArsR/SmtB family transcription factor [Gemmatimonadaceae bacterium]